MAYRSVFFLMLLASPLVLHAQSNATFCGSGLLQGTPVRPTVLSPLAIELAPASYQLGNGAGVLGQAFDEALSVDSVLLRIKLAGCQPIAKAVPAASVVSPEDPAAYKPRTEFDNAPWRFDMTQNGKKMTADEFSAWMTSRGVRVAKGAGAAPAQAAPATTPAPEESRK